jgi:hypothetical protein
MSRHIPLLTQMTPAHAILSRFFKTYFNIIIPSTPMSSQVVSLLQDSPPKPCKHFSPSSHVPHAPPTPYTWTWSPAYFVNSTNNEAPRYAIFSSFLLLHLLCTNVFVSTVLSSTLHLCFSINVRHRASNPYNTKTQKFSHFMLSV